MVFSQNLTLHFFLAMAQLGGLLLDLGYQIYQQGSCYADMAFSVNFSQWVRALARIESAHERGGIFYIVS